MTIAYGLWLMAAFPQSVIADLIRDLLKQGAAISQEPKSPSQCPLHTRAIGNRP